MSKKENTVLAASLCTKFQGISDETVMIKYMLIAIWYLLLLFIFFIKTKFIQLIQPQLISITQFCNSFMLIIIISYFYPIHNGTQTFLYYYTKNHKNAAAHGSDRCLKQKAHLSRKYGDIRDTSQSSTCCLHGPVDMSHRESHFQQATGDKHLCPFWWLRRKTKVHKNRKREKTPTVPFWNFYMDIKSLFISSHSSLISGIFSLLFQALLVHFNKPLHPK